MQGYLKKDDDYYIYINNEIDKKYKLIKKRNIWNNQQKWKYYV